MSPNVRITIFNSSAPPEGMSKREVRATCEAIQFTSGRRKASVALARRLRRFPDNSFCAEALRKLERGD